ncbi:MAG: ATP-binding protein [Anaerolineae bacterium]|nr:ATP-binding protein [Anaerolineae bacterium]
MTTDQMPYILTVSDTALVVGGSLQLGSPIIPTDLLQQTGLVQSTDQEIANRVMFGYKIPYLPDISTSPHLIAETDKEMLVQALEQQTRLVGSLGKWKGMAFSLRYIWSPEKGQIEIALLGKGIFKPQSSDFFAERMSEDVANLLRSSDFPVIPIITDHELRKLLVPIDNPFIIDLRQHEEIAEMYAGGAYVVYPFRLPMSTWITAFRMLSQQKTHCFINIHLQPTYLYYFEQEEFSRAAQVAESVADMDLSQMYLTREGRISDPIARVVARLYSNFAHRLSEPFLLTVQVGSSDPLTAQNVAQVFKNEMSEQHSLDEASKTENLLPSGCDLVFPQNENDRRAAYQTLGALELYSWGYTDATVGKERLRYLTDARAATAGFRFPVPVRGGVPGIPTRQTTPDYHIGRIVREVAADEISIGEFTDRGSLATIPLQQLNRHALIAGFTGTGKTTTCMHLLGQIWDRGIPFLVIEPVKTEYRALIKTKIGQKLNIFTLGDESVSPFRLNPLEILPGVRVEAHIAAVRACFEASLPSFGVLPSLIEESLHNVYMNKSWNLTDRGKANDTRLMPTLGELYIEIIRVTESRGYSDKTLQDIRAAAAGRIASLLRGSKGRMLNTRRSVPFSLLMNTPTILELESLNDEERALIMLFLLTMIREYCRATRRETHLQHITLIEEAHRVMGATSHVSNRDVSSDTRAQAVEMFSTTLSEVRSFGEGLLIAEQVPIRLGEDALKNTNLKIVHRLPGEDDRHAVGATMNMSQEQQNHISLLSTGQAAVFFEGYEKPSFTTIPNYKKSNKLPERIFEDDIETHMTDFRNENRDLFLPFEGCKFCEKQCQYRERITSTVYDVESDKRYRQVLLKFQNHASEGNLSSGWTEVVTECQQAVASVGLQDDRYAAYCYFVHLWELDFGEPMAVNFYNAKA